MLSGNERMKKKYKYKREHFNTQQEFDRFRNRMNVAQKRWREKAEAANPNKRELRLLRQRLYSRFYYHTEGRKKFSDWLFETYGITDIKSLTIDELKVYASKS